MARRVQFSTLEVVYKPEADGRRWFVKGRFQGKQTRKRFDSRGKAEAFIYDLESSGRRIEAPKPKLTWLEDTQLRDAEAAVTRLSQAGFEGMGVGDVVDYFLKNSKPIQSISWESAAYRYEEHILAQGYRENTAKNRRQQMIGFGKRANISRTSELSEVMAAKMIRSSENLKVRLKAICNWLIGEKLLDRNYAERVLVKKVRKPNPSIFEVEELEKLIKAAAIRYGESKQQTMLPYFLICAYSGVRPTEAKRLNSWGYFEFGDEPYIKITEDISKTNARFVAISSELKNALSWCKDQGFAPNDFSRWHFEQIRSKARLGFAWKESYSDVLRHCYASYTYALNPDMALLKHNMGNSEAVLKKHYLVPVAANESRRYLGILITVRHTGH
ncbi:MAG: hypothetical protein AAGB06_04735 [Verrucomicrobiota bacterium]